ncbi:MAG: hypothetical protein COV99_07600 [Bacteroidetes bacterium CG12_big_fil_rev_8_21_14_0_65_60_17]|nr:MAG: hypothetical protein COV99_07600 [Bacteroidetes bacterium CG12_big_fil_rev_8_21_14_0_65_60_17]
MQHLLSVCIIALLLPASTRAQQVRLTEADSTTTTLSRGGILFRDGHLVDARLGGDSSDEVHIIVALKTPEASGKGAGSENPVPAFLDYLHRHAPPGKRRPAVNQQFSLPAPGVALTVTADMLSIVRRAPGVIHMETDDPVEAYPARTHAYPRRSAPVQDSVSVETIGAEAAWQEFGVSGAGITIAVLDSGVDYMHPAFGGAFGPGARVRGGYDFVNGDEDPMDDNGHGSHVAGIAAGIGPLIAGVAPAASLLAVKVLDHTGSGRESHILAGIDWAVRAGADIINLSLGGAGHPDDLLGQAVDAAAAAGVVVVAATGNSGRFQDVGTPAAAAGALGVGSVSRTGEVSSFSSRGPTLNTFAVKPELVAPGEQILSARPGGGFQVLSGTSMATPHVAGAAALVMEARPDLSESDIRHLLAATSASTGNNVFEQGAGLLRVDHAIRAALVPSAASLNFGLIGSNQGIVERRVEVTFRNTSQASLDLALAVEPQTGGLPPQASVRVEPSRLAVPPGAVAEAALILTVNSAQFTDNNVPPNLAGWLVAESTTGPVPDRERLRIPFSAASGNVLQLSSTHVPLQVAVLTTESAQLLNPGARASVLLEAGTYDVVAAFELENPSTDAVRRSVITRRGVEVNGATAVELDAEDVSRWIPLNPVGPSDRTAIIVSDFEVIRDLASGTSLLLVDDQSWDEIGFSTGEAGIQLDWMGRVDAGQPPEPAWTPITIRPTTAIATNDARDLLPIDLTVARGSVPSTPGPLHVGEIHWTEQGVGLELVLEDPELQRLTPGEANVAEGPHRMWHGRPPPEHEFRFFQMNVHERAANGRRLFDGPLVFWTPEGPALGVTTNTSLPWVRVDRPLELRYGNTAPFWNGRMFQLTLGRSYFGQPPFIRGQDFEAPLVPIRFRLVSGEGRTVDEQLLLENAHRRGFRNTIEFTPGEHEMLFEAGAYVLDGIPGRFRVSLRFNSLLQPRPPTMFTHARLLDAGGRATTQIDQGASGEVRFFHDVGYEAEIAIRRTGTSLWESLPVVTLTHTANVVDRPISTATVGPGLEPGFHDVRVQLRDDVGTLTEVVTSPHFRVGRRDAALNSAPSPATLIAPDDSLTSPQLPVFQWNAGVDGDPGDLVFHEVRVRGPGLDTTIVVRDKTVLVPGDDDVFTGMPLTTGQFVPDAWYAWSVSALDGLARSDESSVRHFRLESKATSVEETHVDNASSPDGERSGIRAAYPIPAPGGRFTVEVALPAPGDVSWELFDVSARRVARGHAPSRVHTFQVNPDGTLPPGIYALVVTTTSGTYRRVIPVGVE